MVNLKRYIELQNLLNQLEHILAIDEEIERLEREALDDGIIFIRDGKGGWETSQLTDEEREVFQAMDQGELIIVAVGEEQVRRVLAQIADENAERAGMIRHNDMLQSG